LFSYISGVLEQKCKDYLVIDVNGIGYKISTSYNTFTNIAVVGEKVKLYTHLYVREDIMCIYGFSSREELGVFELLITVSGIGPKAAVAILSEVTPAKFSFAVVTEDVKTLTKAQGIGNKIAQRIILELKDKLKKENIQYQGDILPDLSVDKDRNILCESVNALMVLGYTNNEANRAVNKGYREDISLEELIKESLKILVKM
jgi:Holliday junction DNA helicase RuvA